MRESKSVPWVVGAVLVALIISAGAWFLTISPRLDAASSMQDQTANEQAQINQLTVRLAGLKKDFANIETFRADLAGLQGQLPATLELPTLTRQVDAIAEKHKVLVEMISSGAPSTVTLAAPSVQTVAPGKGTTNKPVKPGEVPGLYAMPVQIKVIGSFSDILGVIDDLQMANPRLVLTSNLHFVAQLDSAATAGKAAVKAGDVEVEITAFAYTYVPQSAPSTAPPAVGTVVDAPKLQVPAKPVNPFLPVK